MLFLKKITFIFVANTFLFFCLYLVNNLGFQNLPPPKKFCWIYFFLLDTKTLLLFWGKPVFILFLWIFFLFLVFETFFIFLQTPFYFLPLPPQKLWISKPWPIFLFAKTLFLFFLVKLFFLSPLKKKPGFSQKKNLFGIKQNFFWFENRFFWQKIVFFIVKRFFISFLLDSKTFLFFFANTCFYSFLQNFLFSNFLERRHPPPFKKSFSRRQNLFLFFWAKTWFFLVKLFFAFFLAGFLFFPNFLRAPPPQICFLK